MKKIIYILTFFLAFGFAGCNKDLLDTKPLDQFSDADFWKDNNLAITFVNSIYKGLQPLDGFYDDECLTNNASNGVTWAMSHSFTQYGWKSNSTEADRQWHEECGTRGAPWDNSTAYEWKVLYKELRACNVAINNLIAGNTPTARLKQLLGEARFLRAYKYHELTRKFGGVILLDKALGPNDDLNQPRSTYKVCVDFIISDLDEAAKLLPDKWSGSDVGRASKLAALALKGRVQLFAGRWADAAATYKQIIDNKGNYGTGLFADFKGLFLMANKNNKEVILDCQILYPNFVWHAPLRCLPGSQNGWGAASPSQNLVDQFELKDGKAWNDVTSTYYNAKNPYDGRDPRFYATIMYDQGIYFGKRLETGTGRDGKGTLIKGTDIEKSNDVTQTAYYLQKQTNTSLSAPYDGNSQENGNNIILMRYAEVLLGYAEAQNEAAGPDPSVYAAINELRARVSMPALPAGLSKDDMRKRIRKERRVELCFEYIYYWDLMRWHAIDQLTEPLNRVVINYTYDLNSDGSVKVDNTTRKVVLSRIFSYVKAEDRYNNLGKDYNWFHPIPQTEIDKNPNLKQNGQFQDEVR